MKITDESQKERRTEELRNRLATGLRGVSRCEQKNLEKKTGLAVELGVDSPMRT